MEFYRKEKLLLRAAVCGFILTVLISFTGFSARCEALSENVLRLHVLANSDSQEDQAVKLLVRDAVLEEVQNWCSDAQDFDTALAEVCTHLEGLEAAANRVLEEEGASYRAKAEVCSMYFTTRTYETGTMPAGKYRALRISLGDAQGHNWWCVAFPSLCVPGASDLDALPAGTQEMVSEPERFEVRFKAVEIFNSILDFFDV